jgi:hypothetical protein
LCVSRILFRMSLAMDVGESWCCVQHVLCVVCETYTVQNVPGYGCG